MNHLMPMNSSTEDQVLALTWLEWARVHAPRRRYELIDAERGPWHPDDLVLLGLYVQACAEQPAEFARIHAGVLGEDRTHPLTAVGEGALLNLVRNGVCDDWEVFLQWTERGYLVVNESQRRPQDARMHHAEARRVLDTITGGLRRAPGLADEGELIQSFYELEPFQP